MTRQEHIDAATHHLEQATFFDMEAEGHEVERLNAHQDNPDMAQAACLEEIEAKARDAATLMAEYHRTKARWHTNVAVEGALTGAELADLLNNTGGAFPTYVGKGQFEWINVGGPGGSDKAPDIKGLEIDICNAPNGMKLYYIATVGQAEAVADPEDGLWEALGARWVRG